MIIGMDHLGLGHKLYPIEAVRDITPKGYAIGCFDRCFGDVLPNLRVLLASGKFPAYRIHIGWDDFPNPTHKYPSGTEHKIIPPDLLRRRAAVYEALALEFPLVKFYLSHSCEHDEHDKTQVQKRIGIIKKWAPSCIPVNCPSTGVSLARQIDEFHDSAHPYAEPYLASMDGCGTDGAGAWIIGPRHWKELHKRAELLFWWVPEMNGRKAGETAHIPPLQRTKFITADEIKTVIGYTL